MSILQDEEPPLFKTADFTFTKRKIEEDDDIKKLETVNTSLAMRLTRYLVSTKAEDLIEIINAFVSFWLAFFFAIDTYYQSSPTAIQYIELVIVAYLAFDFLLFFFISENRLLYLFSFQSFISYLTIIPTFIARVHEFDDPFTIKLLLFWRVFRVFAIYRLDKFFSRRNMSLIRAYFKLIYIFLATVVIFAAALLMVENRNLEQILNGIERTRVNNIPLAEEDENLPDSLYKFHDMFYYMVITITTVGYGDIYPRTLYGQLLIIAIIFVILALLPKQWQEFSKVSSLTSEYARKSYHTNRKKDTKHILLLGDASPEAIKTFLCECYHSDHGITDTDIVIMKNHHPNEELQQLLKMPSFEGRVIYLQGNPMNLIDLRRAQAEKAKCCVVLSNQFCKNTKLEDYRNILNAFAVKKFARIHMDREIRLCLQIAKLEHKVLFYSGLNSQYKFDQVICVEELKLQLLAKSSICPGIITIIWSLITSQNQGDTSDPELELLNYKNKHNKGKKKTQNSFKKTMAPSNINTSASSTGGKKTNGPKYSNLEKDTPRQSQDSYFDTNDASKFQDPQGLGRKQWQVNYDLGIKYELYRVPLKGQKFEGLQFKDVCMILYHKKNLILIALEVRIMDQIQVFVNPAEFIFNSEDHFGYVIYHQKPDFDEINKIDLTKQTVNNHFLNEYICKKEQTINKKEHLQIQLTLAKLLEEEYHKTKQIYYENFYSTKKPATLKKARIEKKLPKHIDGHIIVCGIVKGIRNLILPLRSKILGSQRRPIIILSNDNFSGAGDENSNGDTYIWSEINRFEEIYFIKGSALNPADLEKARVHKAKAVIILAKNYENTSGVGGENIIDADSIFMYKTIKANYKNVIIVTELASMRAIAFLVQGNEEKYQKQGYYTSRPFAAGEIYVSSLLDSLMCQAYYSPKITEILEQMIMGSSHTPEKIMKLYRQLNLSQCSLNLIEIPKNCPSLKFSSIFKHCIKDYNMVPIGVYKRYLENKEGPSAQSQSEGVDKEDRNSKKPYVWLHPPSYINLSVQDELFVLCDKTPKDTINEGLKERANMDFTQPQGGKLLKNKEKKFQKENLSKLSKLNTTLQDLLFSTKELSSNADKTSEYINNDLGLKIRSDLGSIDS